MAITYTFKGSKGGDRYGYYAYIEDGLLVVGEDWPHEGGVIYKNTYANAKSVLGLLKKEAPKLYKGIVEYYKENHEVTKDTMTYRNLNVEDRMRFELEDLADRYDREYKWELTKMSKSDTTEEKAKHLATADFYKSLSKSYRMLAIEAKKHVMPV